MLCTALGSCCCIYHQLSFLMVLHTTHRETTRICEVIGLSVVHGMARTVENNASHPAKLEVIIKTESTKSNAASCLNAPGL